MIYLLWGLLNVGLFLFFIVICLRATKLIRQNLGLFASIVFVFGLLSFIGHSNKNDYPEPNSNQIKSVKTAFEVSVNSNSTSSQLIVMEKTLISKYCLFIQYSKDNDSQTDIPIRASSLTNGFSMGTNWKPVSISISKTDDNNKFEYHVNAVVAWKLLGATIYTQHKAYKGLILPQ